MDCITRRFFSGIRRDRTILMSDTGSDLTWIQCDAPCTSCAKGPHPLYKPTKGKIIPPKDTLCVELQRNQNVHCDSCQQCDYEIAYADRSSSMGVLARDELHLEITNDGVMKSDFVFGCAYDQQGQLLVSPAKTDGILGLSNAEVSLPSQLVSQGVIRDVIGHCISGDAAGGGYLMLGDDYVPLWGMTWVQMLLGPMNYYEAEVKKMSYGGQNLAIGGSISNTGRVIFDTGSSYTYFTKEAYLGLISSLKDISPRLTLDTSDETLPVCWRADFPVRFIHDVKQFFKPLKLHFRNKWWVLQTSMQIPPEGYLIISKKGNVCLGILDGSEVHDGLTNILGDISLRGQLVVYDNINQKIGWVESDCTKPHRLNSFPFF
ncbi:Aspartic proteinase Asp1 [Acorus calamus]|uniref:Aspartic proteinase Asp1 n=1 Tax=Acorus calamus TaxID=4465 RepID=A0AAV9ELA3_ACOCL|nr:Aspartic proteinase Asp1 [Acorus calamus]